MTRFKLATTWIGGILSLCLSVTTTTALAEDFGTFCHWYARTAVSQGKAARAVDQCYHLVEEVPIRWHLSYGKHFHDCMDAGNRDASSAEHQARADALNECINN